MSTSRRGGNRPKKRRTVRNLDLECDDIAEESQMEGWDAGDRTAANASAETASPAQSRVGLSPGQRAGLAAAGKVQRDRVGAEDIDQETGNPKPGAVKVSYEWGYDIGGGVTVTGAWSLRMFVLAREAPDTHEKWNAAKKSDLVAQCHTYMDFKHEKTMLQWLALEHKNVAGQSRPHRVIYGVRFHCELAVVESVWAYIVEKLRTRVDGKALTLCAELVQQLAFEIKPDVVGRLMNRPTEAMQLYSLHVCSNLTLAAGLSATHVFAIQRAFSGYGNKKDSTAGHARSSLAGALADATYEDDSEGATASGLEFNEVGTGAVPRGEPVGLTAPPNLVAVNVTLPVPASASDTVPEEVPDNLWELLSCVKEKQRRSITDWRKTQSATYAGFVAEVQRAWNSQTGRAVLQVLENRTLASITPEFALQYSVVLSLRVPSTLKFISKPE